jgi:nucleolar protein 4
MFSSYAPVRAAFVVSSSRSSEPEAPAFGGANTISLAAGRDRTGKSTSRGFGYVRFVLRTDAEQCLAEWGASAGFPSSVVNELRGQEGLQNVEWDKLTGSSGMKMSWAKKKLKDGEKPEGASADWKEKKPKAEKKDKKAAVATEGDEIAEADADAPKWRPGVWDHNAPRTVIVFGLPLPDEAGSTEEGDDEEDESKQEPEEEKEVEGSEDEEKMAVDGEAETAPEAGPSKPKGKPIDWKKALKQRVKKLGGVEDVNYPFQLPTGEIAGASFSPLLSLSAVLTSFTQP